MKSPRAGRPRRPAFTLVELLVVITIILIVSVATLPVVVSSMGQSQINYAARLLHGELARARDSAVRDNAARGIRLLPDPTTLVEGTASPLTASRLVAIEQGPDYNEGELVDLSNIPFNPGVTVLVNGDSVSYNFPPLNNVPYSYGRIVNGQVLRTWIVLGESKTRQVGNPVVTLPQPPTSWFWNIRRGERVQIGGKGPFYPIAGPTLVAPPVGNNPEQQLNWGDFQNFRSMPNNALSEFLVVLDGRDNDGDGYVDEAFDGVNNDNDYYPSNFPIAALRGQPIIDPGFNGIDDNQDGNVDEPLEMFFPNGGEYEPEGILTDSANVSHGYTIRRRAVPSRGAREIALPRGVVIDLTTWDYPPAGPAQERSRVPVDPYTRYVDILVAPSGEVVALPANANPGPPVIQPFYHLWLADAEDVRGPYLQPFVYDVEPTLGIGTFYLPLPGGTRDDNGNNPYPGGSGLPVLEKPQRLVSINTRTGQVLTTTPVFSLNDPNRPFENAQAGRREEP